MSLADAFTREHHEIDAGIEAHLALDTAMEPKERAVPLLTAMDALRRHIYLEEENVFPHLPAGPLMTPLMVMRREHGELWQRMDALAEALHSDEATAEILDSACHELLSLLDSHNSKEEPVIYPHLDADLDAAEQERVQLLLEEGTLPDGWICEALR